MGGTPSLHFQLLIAGSAASSLDPWCGSCLSYQNRAAAEAVINRLSGVNVDESFGRDRESLMILHVGRME